jgi:hypothetical protein
MTTFIADYIFGKRDQRPRSRPSPARRLLANLRAPARPQTDAAPAETQAAPTDTGPSTRISRPRGSGEGLAG